MASTTSLLRSVSSCYTGEPSLDDLFAEPIVQLFMERDQVNPQDIRSKLHNLLNERRIGQA